MKLTALCVCIFIATIFASALAMMQTISIAYR